MDEPASFFTEMVTCSLDVAFTVFLTTSVLITPVMALLPPAPADTDTITTSSFPFAKMMIPRLRSLRFGILMPFEEVCTAGVAVVMSSVHVPA